MFSTSDTIVAIATPPGRGGIGIVRLSGSNARAIAGGLITHARPLEPRHATFTLVKNRTYVDPSCLIDPSYVVSGLSRTVVASGFPALSGCEGSRTLSDAEASGRTAIDAETRSRTVLDTEPRSQTVTDAIDHVVVTYFPAPHS